MAGPALVTELLIDGRRGIHHQSDNVANLLFRQNAVVAEAGHQAACGKRIGVVDLAPDISTRLVGESAELAEPIKRRPDRSIGQLVRLELMTCVAVRADRSFRIVGELL